MGKSMATAQQLSAKLADTRRAPCGQENPQHSQQSREQSLECNHNRKRSVHLNTAVVPEQGGSQQNFQCKRVTPFWGGEQQHERQHSGGARQTKQRFRAVTDKLQPVAIEGPCRGLSQACRERGDGCRRRPALGWAGLLAPHLVARGLAHFIHRTPQALPAGNQAHGESEQTSNTRQEGSEQAASAPREAGSQAASQPARAGGAPPPQPTAGQPANQAGQARHSPPPAGDSQSVRWPRGPARQTGVLRQKHWVQKEPPSTLATRSPVRGSTTLPVFHCRITRRRVLRAAVAGHRHRERGRGAQRVRGGARGQKGWGAQREGLTREWPLPNPAQPSTQGAHAQWNAPWRDGTQHPGAPRVSGVFGCWRPVGAL